MSELDLRNGLGVLAEACSAGNIAPKGVKFFARAVNFSPPYVCRRLIVRLGIRSYRHLSCEQR